MTTTSKILIVDDDPIVTSTLQNVLLLEGFGDVVFFNNPYEAIEFLKTEKVGVIVSDFLMPQMNGIDFLAQAKKYIPDVSAILLTGYADKENAIKGINEVGLYKYLEKPWDNDELILSIRNGLERFHLISSLHSKINELEVANKKIDTYNRQLEKMVEEKTENLSNVNKKLSAIINFSADGIVTIDEEGVITQVNQSFETLLGIGENLLLNTSFFDIFEMFDYKNVKEKMEKTQEFFIRDVWVKNKLNERKIPVEISVAPIINSNEKEISFVCVVRNVQLQKEMDRLRDDFIATLTHDLRTPLLATIQALEFFLDGTLGAFGEKQTKILSTMKKSNEDILGLVNALLEVYKYESGRMLIYKEDININEVINFVHEELKPLAEKRNIKFSFDIKESENLAVKVDKNEIRRVLVNLCANAINHNKDGHSVFIKTELQEKDLLVSIKDDGEGIAKKDIPKIFKRFSQVSDHRVSVGTGLGLYLSRQIVEAHGGKIWIESDKNKGSEFFFLLPDCISNSSKIPTQEVLQK